LTGCHDTSRTVPLTVLPGETAAPQGRKIKKSRASFWRVIVLILVHVAFAIHLGLWWRSGQDDGVRSTLGPVEPSEAMYTIQSGQLNPGAILLMAILLSTLLMGRWFCGWACHVVALQDLCAWMMKKVGVHPKPFRTRLVLWGTLVMAFYMFGWPAFHRWVLTPALGESLPMYFGRSAPWPGLETHLVVEDLWATFPPIAIAIPFLLVCGFVVVYFLGAKGYCTYGCPYGALFSPADRFAPARIVVNDNCEHCGHCTAVCTSNVRVHEEVRDYGMVVDPGCMKCLDCVSVCPNGALSFGIGKPSILAAPRDEEAKARRSGHPRGTPRYDLSLKFEIVLFLVWVGVLFGIRGMMGVVPLLFASGLAALATFGVAKSWQILREPNVRAQNLQLKLKGRLKPFGALTLLMTAAMLGASAWSGYVRLYLRDTAAVDHVRLMQQLGKDRANVMSKEFVASSEARVLAERVKTKLERSDAWRDGGLGWDLSPIDTHRLAQARLALADLKGAQDAAVEILEREKPQSMLLAADLIQIMSLRGMTLPQMHEQFDVIIAAHPKPGAVSLSKATLFAMDGKFADAKAWINRSFYAEQASDPATQVEAARLLTLSGEPAQARERLDAAIKARPRNAELLVGRALVGLLANDGNAAENDLRAALAIAPRDIKALTLLAQVLDAKDLPGEAAKIRKRLAEAQQTGGGPDGPRDAPNAN
jgi:polyferredoxin/tetratricopeptide (TPR) repeat protein